MPDNFKIISLSANTREADIIVIKEAVVAFTEKKIRFIDIPVITEKTLSRGWKSRITSFDEIYETDFKARKIADKLTSEIN